MGFIEKFVGLMNGQQEQESAAQIPGAPTEQVSELGAPNANQEGAETEQQPKAYTPEELENLLTEKKQEWLAEQQTLERERLQRLPADAQQMQEQLSKEKEIADLKSQLLQRDLKQDAVNKLSAESLPINLADLLDYTSKESMEKSLDDVKETFKSCLATTVKERLRGKTPAGVGVAEGRDNFIQDPFAQAFSQALKK